MAKAILSMPMDIWFDRSKVEEEEYRYQVYLAQKQPVKKVSKTVTVVEPTGVASQIAQARQKIHDTLHDSSLDGKDSNAKVEKLESENAELKKLVTDLVKRMTNLETRLQKLEDAGPVQTKVPEPAEAPKKAEKDDTSDSSDSDSEIDFLASDSESESEKEKRRQQKAERIAEQQQQQKKKKPGVIAKSSIVLDVKPWDDETDMEVLEKCVRSIQTDGLLWGGSALEKVAYGILKLRISCVVEDEKIGTDFLEEKIIEFEDYVQSVDVYSFNKI